MSAIPVTTTPTIQGTKIVDYLGIVRAIVAPGVGPINDWKAGVADTVGWRATSVENLLLEALQEAEQELIEQAVRMGASAIVGASHILADYDRGEKRALQFVMMTGTAVVIESTE